MESKIAVGTIFALCLIGAAHCKDSIGEDDSEELASPPSSFEYKVKALNTALYYILQALQDDLEDGVDVDISFIKRINVIIILIKAFNGKVDETNALMLGELRRTFPEYLLEKMEPAGLSFEEYASMTASGTIQTSSSIGGEI